MIPRWVPFGRPPCAACRLLTFTHSTPPTCTVLQAFLDAIDAIGRQGTLLVPAGRYLIRKQLHINNRVVLRGETPCCIL